MPKVLIVDDEQSLILSLKTGLKEYKKQFEVFVAGNGKEAIDILESTRIDLLITDLQMPVMNGFELLAYTFSNCPQILCVVMTAFNTPDIEQKLLDTALMKLVEKPIDIDTMIDVILTCLKKKETGSDLPGISLSNYLQLLSMEGKTCVIEIQVENKDPGLFYFNKGQLYDAVYDDIRGEDAVYAMLELSGPKILLKNLSAENKIKKTINNSLMTLLLEFAKTFDEQKIIQRDNNSANDISHIPEKFFEKNEDNIANQETKMAKGVTIETVLEKLSIVNGFLAVGAFSPNGEPVAEYNISGIDLDEIGGLANDVLLKAKKTAETMELGQGQMIHIQAFKAHIIARCLNEEEDDSVTDSDKAHVHMVIILKPNGNVAMAKIKLESVIKEIASFFK